MVWVDIANTKSSMRLITHRLNDTSGAIAANFGTIQHTIRSITTIRFTYYCRCFLRAGDFLVECHGVFVLLLVVIAQM